MIDLVRLSSNAASNEKYEECNLELNGIYHLPVVIVDGSLVPLMNKIIAHNKAKDVPYVQIYCNTYGGSLDEALSFTDFMEMSNIPIYTIANGLVASAGSLIFCTGNKGNRVVFPRARIMTHQLSAGAHGKYQDIDNITQVFKLYHKDLVEHYMRHTNIKTYQESEKTFLNGIDKYFLAKEAVKVGLGDKVATKLVS